MASSSKSTPPSPTRSSPTAPSPAAPASSATEKPVSPSATPVSSVVFLSSTAIGTSTVVVVVDNLFPVNVIECVVGYDSGVAFTVLMLARAAHLCSEVRGGGEPGATLEDKRRDDGSARHLPA